MRPEDVPMARLARILGRAIAAGVNEQNAIDAERETALQDAMTRVGATRAALIDKVRAWAKVAARVPRAPGDHADLLLKAWHAYAVAEREHIDQE